MIGYHQHRTCVEHGMAKASRATNLQQFSRPDLLIREEAIFGVTLFQFHVLDLLRRLVPELGQGPFYQVTTSQYQIGSSPINSVFTLSALKKHKKAQK